MGRHGASTDDCTYAGRKEAHYITLLASPRTQERLNFRCDCKIQPIKLLPLPNYRNSKELTADISLYAAVPAGCQVPEIAYEFVRFAMDGETAVDGELSINRSCVQAVLDELAAQHGITIRMGSKDYHIYKMREEVRTQCEEILGRIAAGHIRSAGVEDIFTEIMEGYITGTEEWDDQYEEMKERLEAY